MKKKSEADVVFYPLDPDAEIVVTERNLPHWLQLDAATFVTFRTADSIPREVLRRWQLELQEWLSQRHLPIQLAEMAREHPAIVPGELLGQLTRQQRRELQRMNDRLFHRSLDECHGRCLLRNPELATIVAEALHFFAGARYDLDRFVIMPNHVHVIAQFHGERGFRTVSASWLRFTAREINRLTGQTGSLWQPEPFDHIIRSAEQFAYIRRYIAENPAKANLKSGEYLYWERRS